MRSATQLRRALVGANLALLLAVGWAALRLVVGAPLVPVPADFNPVAHAIGDADAPRGADQGLIARELDRALEIPPPESAPVEPPAPSGTPPPAIDLVAVLSHPEDPALNLAIVRGSDGVQRMLRVGDSLQEGAETWSVVRLRVEPVGAGEVLELGLLTLETPTRVHTYEARLRQA